MNGLKTLLRRIFPKPRHPVTGRAAIPLVAFLLAFAALNIWLVGAMGTMMLAVMTRASLGHSGRALHFGRREAFIYAMILLAGVLRIVAAFGTVDWVLHASATAWIAAFVGFAVFYAPVLLGPSKQG